MILIILMICIKNQLETYKTEFDGIIITFDDQNGIPLEVEGKVILTLLIYK